MKALGPICNIEGFLQIRGTNAMIQHYKGFKEGKRLYIYHKLSYSQLQVNASNSLQVTKKSPNFSRNLKMAGGEGFAPSTKWNAHPYFPFFLLER
jgi:hypothetical protein